MGGVESSMRWGGVCGVVVILPELVERRFRCRSRPRVGEEKRRPAVGIEVDAGREA
jgi:hypothetical protein